MGKKFSMIISTLMVVFLSLTSKALAAVDLGILDNIGGTSGTIEDLVKKVLDWLIGLGALVCVVMIIVGGYGYMTAGGDEQKVKSAQKTLTNAIIGLVICFIAVMIVKFVLGNFLT